MALPPDHVEETAALLDDAALGAGAAAIEMFRRSAFRSRVEWSSAVSPRGAIDFHVGAEQGLAARVVRANDPRVAFAAASGTSAAVARSIVRQAAEAEPIDSGPLPLWAGPGEAPSSDDRAEGGTASQTDLAAWLSAAIESAQVPGLGPPTSIWVEHAVTIESLVATNGLRRCRRRTRVWATRVADGIRHTIAATDLPGLDPWAWRRATPVGSTPKPASPPSTRPFSAIFEPESAAELVAVLAVRLHGPGSRLGFEVGGGWRLRDHPNDPEGLGGGQFDDAGFATNSIELADGRRAVARIGRKGHLFRDSYRDPPKPRFTNLAVSPGPSSEPGGVRLRVLWLRIHPLSAHQWIAEVRAEDPSTGDPTESLLDLGDPATLPKRCAAAVGEARRTAARVRTPALVFEGLRFV